MNYVIRLGVKIIQDLWILVEEGTVLYSRVFNEKMQNQLFGALMSALNSFASQLVDGGLTSFELSDKKFSIVRENNILFIAGYPKKIKDKKALEELGAIKIKFIKKFDAEFFKTWDCDVSCFEDFGKEIEEKYLEDPAVKFWEGF